MRALLVALSVPDPASLRAALAAALGAPVDLCQAAEAAVTWLENRPCDLVAVAGKSGVVEAVTRLRRVSHSIPILAVVADPAAREAGAAWLAGADDVLTASTLVAGALPDGLEEVRHPERDILRRTQRIWYAGSGDALRRQLVAKLGTRVREVGLSGEGLGGLTTQDLESPQSSALIVNAASDPDALVLGVRLVKRTYPGMAVVVVADAVHHEAFRRAGADECLATTAEADPVLYALARALGICRASLELDAVRSRETRLRALLEQLPEAVLLVSPEHAVLAVNLAALRLIGAHDARQVLGSPLSPWLEADAGEADSAVALVDAVAAGATRELYTRTRHLADPRRLQLRAVPFQRETGGSPAALIVLREVVDTPALDTPATADAPVALDEARREWDDQRTELQQRLAEVEAELTEARAAAGPHDALAAELATVRAELQSTQSLASELETVPQLLEASRRLARLEQEEMPALVALADDERRAHALETTRLQDRIAELESLSGAAESAGNLEQAARRLADIEAEELPALRDAAARASQERDDAAGALADVQRRVAELEATLDEVWSQKAASEGEEADAGRHAPVDPAAAVHLDVPDEHGWLLQDIAHVGFLRTSTEGRILEVNAHAARLIGYPSATALTDAGALPQPLTLLAGDDLSAAARFEICLQAGSGRAPRWLAGARLPKAENAADVIWLLADAAGPGARATTGDDRPETLDAVLDAVATECAVIVDEESATPTGPRALGAPAERPAAARALDRARVLLAQVSTYRKRRDSQCALDDLRSRLATLDPLLRRLATDDVAWELRLPGEAVHVGASGSEVERCLTAVVTSARDALPLGGRLTLSVQTPDAADADGASSVRRLDASVVLDAQGYGVDAMVLPPTLHELAAGFGGALDLQRIDALTQRLTLRIPRAFVISHAA